jgi:hypothetical protein
MKGAEFIRQARRWAGARELPVKVVASRGKGGHQTLYVGDRLTVVQTGEIPKGTFHAMLRQLGIPKEEF